MKKELLANNTTKYIIPAKKAALKAAILKMILKTSPQLAALPRAEELGIKFLELAMISAALF